MECPQCFRENAPGSKYCIYCGAAMSWKIMAVSLLVFLLIVAVPVACGAILYLILFSSWDTPVELLLLEPVIAGAFLAVFIVLKRKKIRPNMAIAGIAVSGLMLAVMASFLFGDLRAAILAPVLNQVKADDHAGVPVTGQVRGAMGLLSVEMPLPVVAIIPARAPMASSVIAPVLVARLAPHGVVLVTIFVLLSVLVPVLARFAWAFTLHRYKDQTGKGDTFAVLLPGLDMLNGCIMTLNSGTIFV